MKKLITIIALISLISCGKPPKRRSDPVTPPDNPTEPTPTPTPVETKLILRIFGAPWCTNCKTDFPKINEALAKELAAGVRGEIYVETGTSPSVAPTAEDAQSYRDRVATNFSPFADEWPWKQFRKQVQPERKLPAAVVMDKDGNILKVFNPGPTTFVVDEVVAYVKSQLP